VHSFWVFQSFWLRNSFFFRDEFTIYNLVILSSSINLLLCIPFYELFLLSL
jgi:hypothetical protein